MLLQYVTYGLVDKRQWRSLYVRIYIYNEREREREKRKREKAVGREIEQRVRVQSDNFRFMSFVYDGRPPSIDSGGQERRRKKNVCLRVKRKKKKKHISKVYSR